jgi:hypothetical protein
MSDISQYIKVANKHLHEINKDYTLDDWPVGGHETWIRQVPQEKMDLNQCLQEQGTKDKVNLMIEGKGSKTIMLF